MKSGVPIPNTEPLRKALGAEKVTANARPAKRRGRTRAVITISEDAGELVVRVEFHPMAKTKGPLSPSHSAAMHALEAIAAWAKGKA